MSISEGTCYLVLFHVDGCVFGWCSETVSDVGTKHRFWRGRHVSLKFSTPVLVSPPQTSELNVLLLFLLCWRTLLRALFSSCAISSLSIYSAFLLLCTSNHRVCTYSLLCYGKRHE